jgi:hypothetical protein
MIFLPILVVIKTTRPTTPFWLTLHVLLLAMVGATVNGTVDVLAAGETFSSSEADPPAAGSW